MQENRYEWIPEPEVVRDVTSVMKNVLSNRSDPNVHDA